MPGLEDMPETALHPGEVTRPASIYLGRQLLGRGQQLAEIHIIWRSSYWENKYIG